MLLSSLPGRALPVFFILTVLSGAAEAAFSSGAAPSSFLYDLRSHQLTLQIDPAQHTIKARDQLEVHPRSKRGQISVLLHPQLKVSDVLLTKTGQRLSWEEFSYSESAKRLDISFPNRSSSLSFTIAYEGTIHDSAAREKMPAALKGDLTAGLIGPEGVYLWPASHWYPDKPDAVSMFEIDVTIGAPLRVVTQGELVAEDLKGLVWRSRWSQKFPSGGVMLVAGKYSVKTRNTGGIRISTYFFPEEEKASEIFLTAAEEYVKMYSDYFGPYPFKKFDMVQSSLPADHDFPTLALLPSDAVRQGKEFLRPGALDHHIVHSWWGHDVMTRRGTGNWAEALTAYFTHFFYRELKLGEESARKVRQEAQQKYAVQSPLSRDYPLRQFEEKRDDLDGVIGSGKGAMVFHMLRRVLGRDIFLSALKELSTQYGGKTAAWQDLQKVFEGTGNKPLDEFFNQWLDRAGAPQLKLEAVKSQSAGKGYIVSGEVVQEGDPYQLSVPVEVDDGVGKKTLLVDVSKKKTGFSIEVQKSPLSVTVDPNAHLLRRLYPEELIACLNTMLEDHEKVIVVPEKGDEESRKVYTELANVVHRTKGGRILPERDLTEEDVQNASLMLLGESWRNPLLSKMASTLPPGLRSKEGRFQVDGDALNDPDESFLLTIAHPFRAGRWVTVYAGISAASLSRWHSIFYYGWDSYVLFKKGRPARRGTLPALRSWVSHDFLSRELLEAIHPQALTKHLATLTSADAAGRAPGTAGYRKVQAYLAKQLEESGITPIVQPFSFSVKDTSAVSLEIKAADRRHVLKAIPFRYSKEGQWNGPCTWADEKRPEDLQNLSGKTAVLLHFDVPRKAPQMSLLRKIRELETKKPGAIVIFIREAELDALAPFMTYPSFFPPGFESKLKQREKEGQWVSRSMEAAKTAARAREPDFPIESLILIVPYDGQGEHPPDTVLQNGTALELSVRFHENRVNDANIAGWIEGHDPEKRSEFLVLGAHYDHLGKDEGSGVYYPGADDNGSGVAALLEIGRTLAERRKELRRSVLLVFFGGEEWGLAGSRFFVRTPPVPLSQVKAMLSLDSIGGATTEKEVFLIGAGVYPALAQISRRFLPRLGLREGREMDSSIFEFGSDHYPFHLKGIPCLSFLASDLRRIHTPRDTVEAIDLDKLREVARLIFLTAYQILTDAQ
jgi:aminopeptidase N